MKISFPETSQAYETDEEEISLLQVCNSLKVPVFFGCRIGICGTCKVNITGDPSHLNKKTKNEEDFTTDKNERLACQCTVTGDIVVKK